MNYKIIFILALLVIGLGMGLYQYLQPEPFVPADYEPPTITKEQAEQYRAEQEQLYEELNYTGVKE